MMIHKAISFLLPLALLCAAANASTVFNFDADSPGTFTTFTDTAGGLSATFSSSADPGGFVVYPSIFQTLTGNVLGDPGPAFADNLALDVNFNQNLSAITLDFATADFVTPSPFILTAFENSTLVGSTSTTGNFLSGSPFPEGEISFAGALFNRVVFTSAAPDFAVDNLAVAPTPEPRNLGILGAALLLVGVFFARRRKAAALAALSLSATLGAQTTHSIFPLTPPSVSTIAGNGDVNPYGVAFVPRTIPAGGGLQGGDILVSNFNNANNFEGTGTTIVRITSSGALFTFFTAASGQGGLSAALGVLSNGMVLVGNLPTLDGIPGTVSPSRLAVLDRSGNFLGTLGTSAVADSPWGMAVYDTGNGVSGTAHVFVSNVLSGVVSRFDIAYTATSLSATTLVLANGFTRRQNAALEHLGPSGLVYNVSSDTLYVASSADNAVYKIPTAAAAQTTVAASLLISDPTHLHGPIDMAILPDGHFLVANSDGSNADPNQPSELVEYTMSGQFVGQMSIDANNGGAFGLATSNIGWGTIRLAAVDDNTNTLNIWTIVVP